MKMTEIGGNMATLFFLVLLIYIVVMICFNLYLIIKIIYFIRVKKYRFVNRPDVNKSLLFVPILVPIKRLTKIYEKMPDFYSEKVVLKKYLNTLKLYKWFVYMGIPILLLQIMLMLVDETEKKFIDYVQSFYTSFMVIMFFAYMFSFFGVYSYLKFKGFYFVVIKKYKFLEILGVDKYFLFGPLVAPLKRLREIYKTMSDDDSEKPVLEQYLKVLKFHRRVLIIGTPIFCLIVAVGVLLGVVGVI